MIYLKYLSEYEVIHPKFMDLDEKFFQEIYFKEHKIELKLDGIWFSIQKKNEGYEVSTFWIDKGGVRQNRILFVTEEDSLVPCFEFLADYVRYGMAVNPFDYECLRTMNGTCDAWKMKYFYDKDSHVYYCMTKLAFWRIRYSKRKNAFYLEHSPFLKPTDFNETEFRENAIKARYHFQGDAGQKANPGSFLTYVHDHDRAKLISGGNVNRLPSSTKKEKKYKQMAINKKRRKQTKRVFELLNMISSQK